MYAHHQSPQLIRFVVWYHTYFFQYFFFYDKFLSIFTTFLTLTALYKSMGKIFKFEIEIYTKFQS